MQPETLTSSPKYQRLYRSTQVLVNQLIFKNVQKFHAISSPMPCTRSRTSCASSALSSRSPWSTTTPRSPSTNPSDFLPDPPSAAFFQAAASTHSAIESGPPETPTAATKQEFAVSKNPRWHQTKTHFS